MSAPLTTRIPIKDARGNVIDEKEVATYAGLLSRAHEEGLTTIATALVQVPTPDNGMVAIASAVVETAKGKFAGIGDACPENVNRKIVPHLIRMAETRAKARALRDAVNIGIVALEELGGDGDGDTSNPGEVFPRGNTGGSNVRPLPRRDSPRRESTERRDERGSDRQGFQPVTENQRKFLYRLLAERGVEGKAAAEAICDAAQVAELRQVSKGVASRIIDQWKREAEERQDGAA